MTVRTPAYDHYGEILRWVDGDTVDILVDRGFEDWSKKRFRLYGIQCPEANEPGADEAVGHSETSCPVGARVYFKTYKQRETQGLEGNTNYRESFGRYLALIYVNAELTLNDALVDSGNAVRKLW